MSTQFVLDPKVPGVYRALVYLDGCFFHFSKEERLLQAGWQSKEDISEVTFFRWKRKKIAKLLQRSFEDTMVPVYAMRFGGASLLGNVAREQNPEIFIDDHLYRDIENDVSQVAEGKLSKTGMLLHGRPGTGKSQFIKYLSKKYGLPIHVMYFVPDYTNIDIATMFAEIPPRSIILFEDFDTCFDGRNCTMKNEKVMFTFDSILNALDGVHNDYQGVVFVVTVNDLDKVDDSLKKRPSRLKFVRKFDEPSEAIRLKILKDECLVKETEGMTLDQVFHYKS